MPWASLKKIIIIAKGYSETSGVMAVWASGTGVAVGVCGVCILVPPKDFRRYPGASRAWTKCEGPRAGSSGLQGQRPDRSGGKSRLREERALWRVKRKLLVSSFYFIKD